MQMAAANARAHHRLVLHSDRGDQNRSSGIAAAMCGDSASRGAGRPATAHMRPSGAASRARRRVPRTRGQFSGTPHQDRSARPRLWRPTLRWSSGGRRQCRVRRPLPPSRWPPTGLRRAGSPRSTRRREQRAQPPVRRHVSGHGPARPSLRNARRASGPPKRMKSSVLAVPTTSSAAIATALTAGGSWSGAPRWRAQRWPRASRSRSRRSDRHHGPLARK